MLDKTDSSSDSDYSINTDVRNGRKKKSKKKDTRKSIKSKKNKKIRKPKLAENKNEKNDGNLVPLIVLDSDESQDEKVETSNTLSPITPLIILKSVKIKHSSDNIDNIQLNKRFKTHNGNSESTVFNSSLNNDSLLCTNSTVGNKTDAKLVKSLSPIKFEKTVRNSSSTELTQQQYITNNQSSFGIPPTTKALSINSIPGCENMKTIMTCDEQLAPIRLNHELRNEKIEETPQSMLASESRN